LSSRGRPLSRLRKIPARTGCDARSDRIQLNKLEEALGLTAEKALKPSHA
jgi:hypothetical protein